MNNDIEMFFTGIEGKKVALCGLGGSNLPLAEILAGYGVKVYGCDSRDERTLGEKARVLRSQGVTLRLGESYLDDLSEMDVIFRTPGMRFHTQQLKQARENGVIVTSEMEVFFELCPCKIFAITGSDGKTTTTTIIAKMLEAAGKKVHLGGNIGTPLLPKLKNIDKHDAAVVELSSFQLISMRQSPDVAVVTNLAPNHLDVHKDMAEYIDAKKNILLHQGAFSRAVLNLDNEITRGFSSFTRGDTMFFSRQQKCTRGAWVSQDGMICISEGGCTTEIMHTYEILLPGKHNLENYLAAITALWGWVPPVCMRDVAKSFAGVAHRSEFMREVNGVKYYNDSIASSPTRAASGTLSLYRQKIIMIAGGYDKKLPFDELGPVIVDKVKTLILMGDTADKIEKAVQSASAYAPGNPQIIRVSCMEEAVRAASENALAGDIVSLCPACASFDLYPNFEARGNHFRELVNAL